MTNEAPPFTAPRPESATLSRENFNTQNDLLFKEVFGREEHKTILIDFLNSVIGNEFDAPITDITYANVEKPALARGGKTARFDVACVLKNNVFVDIEVQVAPDEHVITRALWYWSQAFAHSMRQGQKYRTLAPAAVVFILGFPVFADQESPVSRLGLADLDTHRVVGNHLRIFLLEISKLTHEMLNKEKSDARFRWMMYFSDKFSAKEKRSFAMQMQDRQIVSAMDAASRYLDSDANWQLYAAQEMARMDEISRLETAVARGRAEERQETVMSCLKRNRSVEEIAEFLDIPEASIRKIAQEHGFAC